MAEDEQKKRTTKQEDTTPTIKEMRPGLLRQWSMGRLFFGLLLLVLGVLALLNNFDVIEVRFSLLWQLWPLLIIGAGLSLLSLRSRWGTVVTGLFIALVLIGVVVVSLLGVGDRTDVSRSSQVTVEQEEGVERAQVSFSGGAGTIDIEAHDSDRLVEAQLESSFTTLSHETSRENGQVSVELRHEQDGSRWWRGNWRNDLTLGLSTRLPLELTLDAGASRIRGDLSSLDLRALRLDAGASSIDLRLGERSEAMAVVVDAGASSIRLRVPQTSGVRVELASGLGSLDLDGLREVSDGVYQTEGYETAERQIDIRGSTGVASFRLDRY